MTDQELIKRLRVDEPACEEHFTANLAADLIEELNERLTAATDDAKEAEAYAEELEARIKELTLQLLATSGQAADALDKLTKAVEALRFYTHDYVYSGSKARAVLAELEGGE